MCYSSAIIYQDSLQGVIPPSDLNRSAPLLSACVHAQALRPSSCRNLSSLRPFSSRRKELLCPSSLASQGISSVCSNNMPSRASTTYGRHISTPIPSAPLAEELCLFMRYVDWFRPASGSSRKRLQLLYPVHLL